MNEKAESQKQLRALLDAVSTESVTPSRASLWLEKNSDGNRKIQPQTVSAYASDMLCGRFLRLSPIVFDESGMLIDGQHTLSAVVSSGETISISVLRNVPRSWVAYLDIQRVRSVANNLHMLHGVSDPSLVGAVSVLLANWERGVRSHMIGSAGAQSPPLTKPSIELFAVENAGEIALSIAPARACYSTVHGMGKSWFALAYILFRRSNAELADDFFDKLASGAGLSEGSPILVTRNRLMASKQSKTQEKPASLLTVLIRAWNAYVDGRELRRVYGLEPGESIPEVQ